MLLGTRTQLLASAAVGLAIGTPAYAQDAPQPASPAAAPAPPASAQATVSEGTTGSNQGTNNAPSDAIIVTAQKRVEVLAKVPQSVTVVGEQTLDRHQATNLQDYLALIPGLSLTGETRGVSRITLRGINTGGVASTVGVYVDDVPFGSSSGLANGAILAGDFDTFDVARLEVLRGPQGTLYGASSLGGVLKFVTNAPNPRGLEARGEVGLENVKGGEMGYHGAAMVNVPLSDKAAIRVSGFYRKDGGFIDSIGNNPLPNLIDPAHPLYAGTLVDKNLNGVKTFGGRASVLVNASDNFSIRLGAILQNINNAGSDYVEVDPVTLKPLYGDVTQSRYLPEWTHVKYRIYSAVEDWNIGFANLTSSTSYEKFSETFQRDWTLALLGPGLPPLAQILSLPPEFGGFFGPRPVTAALRQQTGTNKFTQEFRLASPDNDKFEWLLGAYYTHEKSHIDPQNAYPVDIPTGEIATDLPILYQIFLRSKYREYAAFANGTIHFTPQLDLTLGGRVSENKQAAHEQITGALIGGAVIDFPGLASKESVVTYSVAPRYEINPNTSIYARVASGYRPGGPNALPPIAPDNLKSYKSDRLTSYEAGLKADWFNRKLSLDVAAFYLDWKDIQLFQVIQSFGVNANGGTAVSKGFEFTVSARPVKGLNLSANGAYTDAHLTKATDPAIGGLNGDPLPYVPDWSLNLNADYEWPVARDWNGFVGGSISYSGDRTPDFNVRTPQGDLKNLPAYASIDLRAGMESERWLAELFVRNLTNKRGITSVLTLDPGNYPNDAGAVGITRPRTIGLTVGARFR
jgi:outer membrane receptor protein involved in Fe transport